LIVDQPPSVARSGGVFRQQYVTRLEDEGFAVAGCEFQRAGKGDDILPAWRDVPVQR
jgi:hypothetical protein